jgi:hypothetical protein
MSLAAAAAPGALELAVEAAPAILAMEITAALILAATRGAAVVRVLLDKTAAPAAAATAARLRLHLFPALQ